MNSQLYSPYVHRLQRPVFRLVVHKLKKKKKKKSIKLINWLVTTNRPTNIATDLTAQLTKQSKRTHKIHKNLTTRRISPSGTKTQNPPDSNQNKTSKKNKTKKTMTCTK